MTGEDFIHSSTSDVAGSEGMIPYLQEHILSGFVLLNFTNAANKVQTCE